MSEHKRTRVAAVSGTAKYGDGSKRGPVFEDACTHPGIRVEDASRHQTVNLDGRPAWFACPVEAQSAYLNELNRRLGALRGEHERVTTLLRHLRGRRTYAEITANDNQLDEAGE